MKHTAILLACLALIACEQSASTPTPGPSASNGAKPVVGDSGDGKSNTSLTSSQESPVQDSSKTTKDAAADAKAGSDTNPAKIEKVERTDAEWRELLTEEEYYILRKKGTERAFTGKYDKFYKPGKYLCAGCGLELFSSTTKFDSGCGWPAFYAAKAGDRVKLIEDRSFGMLRTEVVCARCDGHLGHVFDDAPQTPTGERFCINSVAIKFVPAEGPLRDKIADEPEDGKKK